MSDLESLLAGALLRPECDHARLILADCLDEHDMPEWAELCRVQVELQPLCCSGCGGCGEEGPCGLTDYYRKCYTCGGKNSWRWRELRDRERELLAGEAKLRRGVLRETRITPPYIEVWKHRVTFVRGLPVVECTLAECGSETQVFDNITDYREDRNSRMEWVPSAFCQAAMRESGCSVRVSDRKPLHVRTSGRHLWHAILNSNDTPHVVPKSLVDAMEGEVRGTDTREPMKGFPTESAARAALDAAINRLTFAATWPQLAEVTT